MKCLKPQVLAMLLLFSTTFLAAQEKYSKVKISFSTPDQKIQAIDQLQIDHFIEKDGAIYSEVAAKDLQQFRRRGSASKIEVLVDDVAADLQKINNEFFEKVKRGELLIDGTKVSSLNPESRVAIEQPGKTVSSMIKTPSAFTVWTGSNNLGGFYSFAQMNTAMNNLVAAYPSIASKTSLGKTLNNNDLWVIKISDNVATDESNEAEVLFIGLQHAREAIGGSSMIFLMQYLCENYATDSRIKDIIDNREVFIIVCMNPDGWEYNRVDKPDGGGLWRKNRNGDGVDLNRNWGVDWGNCSGASSSCGSSSSTAETYYGTAAFSEKETQIVRDFVYSHHLAVMIDQHAFGPYYSLPFGRPGLHTGADDLTTEEKNFYTRVPALMGKHNGMRAGNSPQSIGYEVAGGVKDWMLRGNIGTNGKTRIFGMTGEGGAGGGTSSNFWPPADQIINLCKGMLFQNIQLLLSAGSHVDVQDVSNINFNTRTGSFAFKIKRIGMENKPVTVTMIPIQNITTVGSPVTISSLPNYYDVYNGSITYNAYPSLPSKQPIKFAWKVQTGGITFYDTVVKYYNPIVMTSDNMDGSDVTTNWTLASNVSENFAYTTSSKFAGTKSLTESPSGDFSSNSTRTATYKTALDLSDATAAYVSFWMKYRAENFQDYMQFQVSTDAGSTWTALVGKNTIQEPGTLDGSNINGVPSFTGVQDDWVREVIDLKPVLLQGNVLFRFYFKSDAASTFHESEDDGFYIDDLTVVKSNVTSVTLAVKFIDFTAQLQLDNSVQLDWKAQEDNSHFYYEVERSGDNNNFVSIGKVGLNHPTNFNDKFPFSGNNYYRIKAVDINGQEQYSKTVFVRTTSTPVAVTLFPNPPKDKLSVRIETNQSQQISMKIFDAMGRLMYQDNFRVSVSGKLLEVPVSSWKSQMYILKMENEKNELITVQKFIKE